MTSFIQTPPRNRPAADFIEDLVDRYTDNLLRGAFSLGFPETEAEELVQATFVGFIDGYDRFQNRSQVLTYLFGILYNKAREARRLQNRHESIDAAIDATFDSHFDSETHWDKPSMEAMTEVEKKAQTSAISTLLQDCMEGLSSIMRMAFTLKEVEGCSTDQICSALELTPTNLGVTLFRARNKLRECLMAKGVVIA